MSTSDTLLFLQQYEQALVRRRLAIGRDDMPQNQYLIGSPLTPTGIASIGQIMSDDDLADDVLSYPALFWDLAEEYGKHPRELTKEFLEAEVAKGHAWLEEYASSKDRSVASVKEVEEEAEECWLWLESRFGNQPA